MQTVLIMRTMWSELLNLWNYNNFCSCVWYRFLEIWGVVFGSWRMQFSLEVWVSRMKGTEVGSAGIQEVSSCFFSRHISTEVHRSSHSPWWIESWLRSPMVRHWGETLGRKLKKMHYMLFMLLPVVLTSHSQTFGCSVSHLVRSLNCLSATACSAQGEPAFSGILEWVQMQLGNQIHRQQLEILMLYHNSCELEFI